jgi:predicted patatin/cPLA2 family phospholipase
MNVPNAIVVEGGAMRGVFAAGVLDVLLEHGLDEPDLAIGTSAGACNLASFLARQRGRNLRCYLDFMARKEMFNLWRWLRGGHYMDLDWLWDELAAHEPLDEQAIAKRRTTFLSVGTCVSTGEARYLTHRAPNVHRELKAGCALPLLYRGPVRVQQHALVDGGLVDPIPAAEAYRRGARRIVVIRSRPAQVFKRPSLLDPLVSLLLREHAAIARAARAVPRRYREALSFIQRPPADVRLIQLAPPRSLVTRRTTQERAALQMDYALGRETAERQLSALRLLLT